MFKYWIPAVLWMLLIFSFSSQPYHQQDMRPWLQDKLPETFIKENFSHIKVNYAGSEVSIQTKGVPGFIEFFVRKGAHVFVYTVLAILIQWAVRLTWRQIGKWGYLITFFLTFLYAMSDEWHQAFTPNRTPKIHDVFIDSFGILLGLLIFIVLQRLFLSRKGKHV